MSYAKATQVTVDRSKQAIEKILQQYGADEFLYACRRDRAKISFIMQERMIEFCIPLPADDYNGTMKQREQEERRRWRALFLSIKAKLVAVEDGISTFEQEFLPHIFLPTMGKTIAQMLTPQLDSVYAGKSLKLLELK